MTFRALAITLVLLGVSSSDADIVYNITMHSGFAPGWSLDSGTVITDGTIGIITTSNFTMYSFTFTSPMGTFTLTSDNSSVIYVGSTDAALVASTTDLDFFPTTGAASSDGFSITMGDLGIIYAAGKSNAAGFIQLVDGSSTPEFSLINPAGIAQPYNVASVAAVPEPSALLLLGAVVGFVGVGTAAVRSV